MTRICSATVLLLAGTLLIDCIPEFNPPAYDLTPADTVTPVATTILPATDTPMPATSTPPHPTATSTQEPVLSNVPAPLAAGGYHTCMVTDAGSIRCWGNNEYGQLGNGTTGNSSLPVEVENLSGTAVAVAAGNNHTCALDQEGAVLCWGDNALGELGDGTATDRSVPEMVTGLEAKAVMIAAGDSFSCALIEDGRVKCWGWNAEGQLGNGTSFDSSFPDDVQGLDGEAVLIAAGEKHACALLTSGGVRCWGRGLEGQLGDGLGRSSLLPVDVAGLQAGVTRIAAGGTYSCAILQSEKLNCWGINSPNGSKYDSNVPIEIGEVQGKPSFIGIGTMFACAVVGEGGVECWGKNRLGQLGNGMGIDSPNRPVSVSGLSSGVAYLAAGKLHACAVMSSGGIRCWGGNGQWQLGIKTASLAYSPIDPDLSKAHYYYSGIEAAAPPKEYPRKYNSIWSLTEEFRELSAPGVNTYAVSVVRKSVWAWDLLQCAADESALEAFLPGVKVTFLVDYQPVSEKAILVFRSNYDSWACQGWTTSLSQWEKDQYELGIVYEYTSGLFDGEDSYPAGKYWQIILLKVEEESEEE